MFFFIIFSILYVVCFLIMFYFSNKAYRCHSKNFSAFVKSRFNRIYFAIAMVQFGIGFLVLNSLFKSFENPFSKIKNVNEIFICMGISILMTFLILYLIRRYYELKIKKNNERKEMNCK